MMGRQNNDQGPLFYEFRLDEAVPDDHLVRKIDAVLDLSRVYAELAPHYPTLGRPSVDPVLMIRMLITRKPVTKMFLANHTETAVTATMAPSAGHAGAGRARIRAAASRACRTAATMRAGCKSGTGTESC